MSNLELLPINIAGEWRLGGGGESTTLYPATGEVVGRLRAPSLEDVEEAIQKADHAFRTTGGRGRAHAARQWSHTHARRAEVRSRRL